MKDAAHPKPPNLGSILHPSSGALHWSADICITAPVQSLDRFRGGLLALNNPTSMSCFLRKSVSSGSEDVEIAAQQQRREKGQSDLSMSKRLPVLIASIDPFTTVGVEASKRRSVEASKRRTEKTRKSSAYFICKSDCRDELSVSKDRHWPVIEKT